MRSYQRPIRLLESARSLDALDRIGEGIFALDADGRIAYVNRTASRLLPQLIGTSADLVGTIIWDASRSFAQTPAGAALLRAATERVPVTHTLRDPVSGRLLELRLFPTAEGLSGLLLEAARPKASDVLDRVSDLYLACDDEWRLTLVNARAAEYLRLLGPERGDPIGRSVWDVIPGLVGLAVPGRGVPRAGGAVRGGVRGRSSRRSSAGSRCG